MMIVLSNALLTFYFLSQRLNILRTFGFLFSQAQQLLHGTRIKLEFAITKIDQIN
jgi:hypothetical protein